MCFSSSGKIVGRAVINRSADDGQSQGHVNRVMKMDQFNGYESLVMIHGDHRIELPLVGPVENRIGRKGAGYLVRTFLASLDRRLNQLQLLAPKAALLSGMGIEPGDTKANGFETKVPPKGLTRDGNGAVNQCFVQGSRGRQRGPDGS